MSSYDTPTFSQSDPYLALAATDCFGFGVWWDPFELERDTAVIFAEGDDVDAGYFAGEALRRARFAEGLDLGDAI